MTVYEEIAAILHPMPAPGDVDEDVYGEVCQQVAGEREETARELEGAWGAEGEEADPLLMALAGARRRRERAEAEIRQLLAYGREFTRPRPYKLVDLGAAAGMSISGVRTAYDHADVDAVAEATGLRPREWRAGAADDPPADHG